MGVRLSAEQRDEVRCDLARRDVRCWSGALAYKFARDRGGPNVDLLFLKYQEAIFRYKDWLERNYRAVRTQSGSA